MGAAKDDGDVITDVFVGFEDGGKGFTGVFRADGVENDEDISLWNNVGDIIGGFHGFFRQHDEFLESKAKFIPNCGKRATREGADGDEGEFDHNCES